MTIGDQIRQWRVRAGHSRRELAELVGGSPSWVADVEYGRCDISRARLAAVAEHCGVGALDLGEAIGLPTASESAR